MSFPVVGRGVFGRPDVRCYVAVGLPLVGIGVSELLVFKGFVTLALWGHLVTVLAVTLAPWGFPEHTAVFQGFVLVPVFRLVNLGMPVFVELTVFWFPLIYGPLVPAVVLIARNLRVVTLSAGWTTAVTGLPLIVLASVALGELEYLIISPEPFIPTATDPLWVGLLALVMIGFVGAVEELLFRGVLQPVLQAATGRWTGVVLTSIVFGMMHSIYAVPAELGFTFGFGLLAGVAYDRMDSLVAVILVHGLMNVFLFGVIPNQGSLLVGG